VIAVGKNKVTIDADKEIHIFDGLSFGSSGMEISDLYKDGERVEKGSGRLTFSCVLKDISKGAEVFRTTDYLQIKNVEQQVLRDSLQIPLNISCKIDKNIVLTLTAKDKTVTVTGGGVETAKTRALTSDDVLKSLSKLGDTSFMLNDAKINVKDGVFVSVKDLNEVRRKGVYLLEQALIKGEEREKVVFPAVETAKDTKDIKIVIGICQRQRPKDCDVFLVYTKNIEKIGDADGIVLPGVSFDDDLEKIEKAVKPGMIVVCNNIGQIERLKDKCRIWAGFGMNCTNSECLKALKGLGCERVFASIEAEVKGAYAFKEGLFPVMTFVACPQKAAVGCESCKGKSAVSNARFTCVDLEHRYSFMLKEYKGKNGQVVFI
ncbi:MAG: DUF3656 domain-containing protein, partial [Clostridia bacterium]|nr:DUF3656 domain-containing protein [Clostridia bacterium]